MRLIEFSLKRRVTISMAAVAVVLFGIVAFGRLPVNLFPELSYPSLTIETRLPGAAPQEIEVLVSRPIEEVVGVVAGVKRLTSVSRPGLSQVTLEFDWGRNMDFAALDVRQKLDIITLPRESERPVLMRFDPANDPIVRLYLTGGQDLYQLRYVAEEIVKKDLESTEGVAAIKVNGGFEEEIQVQVDAGRLARMNLSIQDVNERLRRENVNQAGGSLYEAEARYLVRSKNEFESMDDILDTIVVNRNGRQVRIGDVASVIRGHKPREVITRYDGLEAVELGIYKEGDANTVAVSKALHSRLGVTAGELPEGIELVTGIDQSSFIQASIREVLSNALIGGLIAILVLLLFLKDLRSTLIIGVSIPISIVTTFFLMYQTGTSLNIISLGGLALGVGMLVDNAIVVLEAIFKHREAGASPVVAATRGASEVGRAVAASTLTTVAVFLPVVFLDGIAAQLFRDMAFTVSFALLASLAVSLTLIPMMAAVFGGGGSKRDGRSGAAASGADAGHGAAVGTVAGGGAVGDGGAVAGGGGIGGGAHGGGAPHGWGRYVGWGRLAFRFVFIIVPTGGLFGVRWALRRLGRLIALLLSPISKVFDRFLDALLDAYPRALERSLGARTAVLAVAALALAAAIWMVPRLGFDLMPTFSQGEFSYRVELPDGTPIEVTDRFMASAQEVLADNDRIASYSSITGGKGLSLSSTGTEGENTARLAVRMAADASTEDEAAVIAALRERLAASDRVNFKFERPTLFSFRTPIEVEIYGDSLDEVYGVVAELKPALEAVPGLVEVKSSLELGNPELQISFHRDQLTLLGLTLGEVAETVRNKVQGEVATRFQEGDREIDIVVRSVDLGRASRSDVTDMIIGQKDGRPIYLKSIADIRLAEGPSEIRRIGQKRVAVLSGSLSGRDMGAVAADVRQLIGETSMPAGVTAALSGQEEERAQSLRSMLMAMALAIFLVYLVMASQFESLVHPFIIIFTLPLGAVGVVAALALTGLSINIVVMIGVVMLAGIVVNNAIVLVDSVNQKRQAGLSRHEALIAAGRDRLRPILMTSATTIFGLAPMAIGIGEGAELRAPLAITVIGGLSMATLLTLFVIPVVYSLIDRREPAPAEEVDAAPQGPGEAAPGAPQGGGFSGSGLGGAPRPLAPQPTQARSTLATPTLATPTLPPSGSRS